MSEKFDLSSLRYKALYTKKQQSVDVGILQIPSKILLDEYKNIYNVNDDTKYLVNGSSITDMYFDKSLKEKLKEKLLTVFPEAAGKKIICYTPYSRYRNEESNYLELLDFKKLQESCNKLMIKC